MKKLIMINLCLLWSALVLGQTTEKTLIYFNSGQSDLTPASKAKLNELLGLLKTKALVEINLYGHTDSEGTEAANQILSVYRAMSTNTYLISNGADLSKIKMHAMGETQAISSKADENRRVEIVASYNDIVAIPEIVDIVLPEIPKDVETPKVDTDTGTYTAYYKPFSTNREFIQTFTVSANKKIKLKGKAGTAIKFPRKAFVDSNGNTVKGDIRIELIEVYNKSDMILNNLQTVSDTNLLVSMGMIYVKAYQGTEELKLKTDATFNVSMPNTNSDDGMYVFYGDTTGNNGINWQQDAANPAEYGFEKSWRGEGMPIEVTNYILECTDLGWINCDRFERCRKGTLVVKTTENIKVNVILVFKSINSLMPLGYGSKCQSDGVPIGRRVTVVAFEELDGKTVYYAAETFILEKKQVITLKLDKISKKDFKIKLKELDH